MMGYIRVSPDRSEIVYAAQVRDPALPGDHIDNNVRLYRIPINGSEAPVPYLDETALLAPCKDSPSPMGAGPCTQADTFHPQYDDTDDESGLFAFGYRAWDRNGFPAGNQALAMRDKTGSVTPLTFNASDINTSDECPRFVPGSNGTQLIFIREFDSGTYRHMAHLDIPTGAITVLTGPLSDGYAGCPTPLKDGFGYITDGDNPVMELVSVLGVRPFKYHVSDLWKVGRENTPGTRGSLSLQYCDYVSAPVHAAVPTLQGPQSSRVMCKTAQYPHDILQVALVDAQSGKDVAKVLPNRPSWVPADAAMNWCLTSNSFHVLASA